MARKAKPATAEDLLKKLYPDLMTSDDYEEGDKKDTQEPSATEKQIAELQAKIEQLNGALAARPTSTQAAKIQALPAPVAPTIGKAPDPVADPDAHAAWVAQAIDAKVTYEKQKLLYEQAMAQQSQTRAVDLWSDFASKDEYKNYAKDTEKVEVAAARVLQRKAAAGVEQDSYMYGQSDVFMRDVVKEYDRLFGKPAAEKDDEDDVDANDDDDDDDNRTQILGGSTGGKNGPSAVQKPPSKFGHLSTEIIDFQQKTGFYR